MKKRVSYCPEKGLEVKGVVGRNGQEIMSGQASVFSFLAPSLDHLPAPLECDPRGLTLSTFKSWHGAVQGLDTSQSTQLTL